PPSTASLSIPTRALTRHACSLSTSTFCSRLRRRRFGDGVSSDGVADGDAGAVPLGAGVGAGVGGGCWARASGPVSPTNTNTANQPNDALLEARRSVAMAHPERDSC